MPNTITSDPDGVELTQLVSGEENFYVASADIGSQLTVKVEGSLRIGTVSFYLDRVMRIGNSMDTVCLVELMNYDVRNSYLPIYSLGSCGNGGLFHNMQ